MFEIIKIVDALITNLNVLEVRGQQNLAILFNSIDTLKNLKRSLENPVVTEEKIDVMAKRETNEKEATNVENPS